MPIFAKLLEIGVNPRKVAAQRDSRKPDYGRYISARADDRSTNPSSKTQGSLLRFTLNSSMSYPPSSRGICVYSILALSGSQRLRRGIMLRYGIRLLDLQ